MAVDRDAALKKAEKFLRQGKLAGAIDEYVRLVEDQPRDWNSLNALGDLYVRAGEIDNAIQQFSRVADHLHAEGFFSRAAALYKKSLKLNSTHAHTLLQLADIAVRQGLLADAKAYLRQLADERRRQGDERGAAECIIRLGSLEEADTESQIAAARAAQQVGDFQQAAALLQRTADDLEKQGRRSEALDILLEAAATDPGDIEVRSRLARECIRTGQLERARPFLTPEAAGDNTSLLLALARLDFASNDDQRARASLTRLLTIEPARHGDVLDVALSLAREGRVDSATSCMDLLTDAALIEGDWNRAIRVLATYVRAAPHIPTLVKLVELCVDAGLDAPLREAQAQLADAYLDAGMAAEARFVSQDLLDHTPGSKAHVQRLQRAQEMSGVNTPVMAEQPRVRDDVPAAEDATDVLEIDLSEALVQIREDAGDPYERAMECLQAGRSNDAILELQAAAQIPATRVKAAEELGRLFIERGEFAAAIEWLERAADAPAASPDEGFAVLYDLAGALERVGETARALAIFIDLNADAGEYRDVRARIDALARAQAGSRGR